MQQDRLSGIESLRAYAAVSIIVFHLVFLGRVELVESAGFITSYFGFGVPLFFVVSGFSLTYGYVGRLGSEGSASAYFIRRFARIAPLFYVVLVFQLIFMWRKWGITYTPLEVALNASFVFNVIPHLTDGIVPASWTIGVEMIFYALLPVLLLCCTNLSRTLLLLVVCTFAANQFSVDMHGSAPQLTGFATHNFVKYLPYFVWGIAAYHGYALAKARISDGRMRYAGWIGSALGLFGLWAITHSSPTYDFFSDRDMRVIWDTLWGVPFGLLCIGMALHPTRILSNRVTRYLGMISYSLYLLHPNTLVTLGEWGVYRWIYDVPFAGHPLRAYVVCAVLSVAVIAALSTVTFYLVEKPGMELGKRMAKRITSPAPIPAAVVASAQVS